MKVVVLADTHSFQELISLSDEINWLRADDFNSWIQNSNADLLFNLNDNACFEDYSGSSLPIFINSVSETLKNQSHPVNVVRVNGWHGFLRRTHWEMAGNLGDTHLMLIEKLNIKACILTDEPGFVTARIIAMIINEAFFAKEQQVSTESEIDIAMKLGTNYPKGPFEWANEIGKKNVLDLLIKLSITDKRYQPSALLQKEV